MEQTALNPAEIITYAGLERSRNRRSGSRCVIRLDFESGLGILCDLDRIRDLMRQTNTQHEMFLFKKMVGRPVDPMVLHPIHIFIASRPAGRMPYNNEERGRDLNALAKLQLLRSHVVDPGLCNIIIRRPQCIVNMESTNQSAYGLDSESKDARQASEELGSMGDAGRVQDKGER